MQEPRPPATAGSSQLVRQHNAQRVLESMWGREARTASELMAVTGLTRATILTLCRQLSDQGWLRISENSRQVGQYTKGRPATRYAFRQDACYVIGVDAGQHRIDASVADLRGEEIGGAQRPVDPPAPDDDESAMLLRRREVAAVIDSALEDAGLERDAVASVAIAVPAPVDKAGISPEGFGHFWGQMNPDLISLGTERGWNSVVENDANLAALAELELMEAPQRESFAALLSGERLGAGLVMGGQLVPQPRGAAGELGILDLVRGVESSHGFGWWARHLAYEALTAAETPTGALSGLPPEQVTSEDVFAAASDGDPLADEIMDTLAEKLARVCAVLAGLLDLDRIVISGAMASALPGVVELAKEKLPHHLNAPWLHIEVSSLGAAAVRRGAVRLAIERIKSEVLQSPLAK